jgi:hypothetical protein
VHLRVYYVTVVWMGFVAEADTLLHPVNDKLLYDQVSGGRDIAGLRILKETATDPEVPTFAEAGIIGNITAASGSFSIRDDKYQIHSILSDDSGLTGIYITSRFGHFDSEVY